MFCYIECYFEIYVIIHNKSINNIDNFSYLHEAREDDP